MHIIIKEFVETGEPLTSIIERNYDSKQFFETIFLKSVKDLNNNFDDKNLVLEIDQAILNGHSDNDIYMLFIAYALLRLSRMSIIYRLERAKPLISVGSTISQE